MHARFRRLFIVVVLGAGFAAASAQPALACSCAAMPPDYDPEETLHFVPGATAFVGRYLGTDDPEGAKALRGEVQVLSSGRDVTHHFAVDRVYAGSLPARVDVVSADATASCGMGVARDGRPMGVTLSRFGGEWHAGLCSTWEPSRVAGVSWRRPGTNPPAPEQPWVLGVIALIGISVYGAGRARSRAPQPPPTR